MVLWPQCNHWHFNFLLTLSLLMHLLSIILKSRSHHYSPSFTYILNAFTLFWSCCVHHAKSQSWLDPNPHWHPWSWTQPEETTQRYWLGSLWISGGHIQRVLHAHQLRFPLLDIISHLLPFPWTSNTTSITLNLSWWPHSLHHWEKRRHQKRFFTHPTSPLPTHPFLALLPVSLWPCGWILQAPIQAHLFHFARDLILSH